MTKLLIVPENVPTFIMKVSLTETLPECFSGDGNCAGPGTWDNMTRFCNNCISASMLGIDIDELNVTTSSMWVYVNISAKARNDGDLDRIISDVHSRLYGYRAYRNINALPEEFFRNIRKGLPKITYVTSSRRNTITGLPEDFAVARLIWFFGSYVEDESAGNHQFTLDGKAREILELMMDNKHANLTFQEDADMFKQYLDGMIKKAREHRP